MPESLGSALDVGSQGFERAAVKHTLSPKSATQSEEAASRDKQINNSFNKRVFAVRFAKVSRLLSMACIVTGTLSLSACIVPQHYVDATLGETHLSDLKKPAAPQPIQLLFEFRTKGVANARATTSAKPLVEAELTKSGLFSAVSDEPVASGRKLAISFDNVAPEGQNAHQKAFLTGITWGLDGNTLIDDYVCTFTYLEPGHDPVAKEVGHRIYTTAGITNPPKGLTPVPLIDAIGTVIRQAVDKGLAEIDQASDIAQ
jgi:hypothetical protein